MPDKLAEVFEIVTEMRKEQKALISIMRDMIHPSLLSIKEGLNTMNENLNREPDNAIQDWIASVDDRIDSVKRLLDTLPKDTANEVMVVTGLGP
ncbi:hypothetical protein [Roseicella sp. DB1501]|uniref:hypothetical protein n=1 Tax=Roseicella sp. DB1501 TaxID=2730925 RepID=UPI001490F876|nr:hypothetical protein [Roseicella sp. DB1501]NOG73720.1 hypothetical protein [Roseicella sp. DB1501]